MGRWLGVEVGVEGEVAAVEKFSRAGGRRRRAKRRNQHVSRGEFGEVNEHR